MGHLPRVRPHTAHAGDGCLGQPRREQSAPGRRMNARSLFGVFSLDAIVVLVGTAVLWGLGTINTLRDAMRLIGLSWLVGIAALAGLLSLELMVAIPFSLTTVLVTAAGIATAGAGRGWVAHRARPRRDAHAPRPATHRSRRHRSRCLHRRGAIPGWSFRRAVRMGRNGVLGASSQSDLLFRAIRPGVRRALEGRLLSTARPDSRRDGLFVHGRYGRRHTASRLRLRARSVRRSSRRTAGATGRCRVSLADLARARDRSRRRPPRDRASCGLAPRLLSCGRGDPGRTLVERFGSMVPRARRRPAWRCGLHEARGTAARRVCDRGRDVGIVVFQAPRLAGIDRDRRTRACVDTRLADLALQEFDRQPGTGDRLLRLHEPSWTGLALAPPDPPRPL